MLSNKQIFHSKIDELFNKIVSYLEKLPKSKPIHQFFYTQYISFIYCNLVFNYFQNLTSENVKELNLPFGKIGEIKNFFKTDLKKINHTLNYPLEMSNFGRKEYIDFRKRLKRKFSKFYSILHKIEQEIDLQEIEKSFYKKKIKLFECGTTAEELSLSYFTKYILELFIQKKRKFPTNSKIEGISQGIFKKFLPEIAKTFKDSFYKKIGKYRKEEKKSYRKFQKNFQKQWQSLLNLLELLIDLSLECGETKKNRLLHAKNKLSQKETALVLIHARAVHIASEILCLLKGGFPDGAISRWRSLHELMVVAIFLKGQPNSTSERFLDYEIIKKYKDAYVYKEHYKNLGYRPLGRKAFIDLKKAKQNILKKYNKEFNEKGDWSWIPKTIISNRNFKSLEEYIGQSKWRPFYNMASNATHAGARGFYRLGLEDELQEKVLLVGSSDYGLEDPIQNTAISLSIVTIHLLTEDPDFESLLYGDVIQGFVSEIKKDIFNRIKDNNT